jgi:hypothetical protein
MVMIVEDGETAEAVAPDRADLLDVREVSLCAEADGTQDQAVEVVLDLPHLSRLLLGPEILVNHADAAQKRHGNGHVRFGDGVHRRADEGDVQRDAGGQSRGDRGLGRQKIGILRDQGDIVESQPLVRELLHKSGYAGIHIHVQTPFRGNAFAFPMILYRKACPGDKPFTING